MSAVLFDSPARHVSLPLQEERELIIMAQTGSADAQWELLLQYAGLLRQAAYDVQRRVGQMTQEQTEDLHSELILAALETIQTFDLNRYFRLSMVLPRVLKHVALETATALAIPRGTLNLWFKVWREAGQDFEAGAQLAPARGMSADTFRAISHALEFAGSEWVTVPHDGAHGPTADDETYRLAHLALDLLTPGERDVIELFFGFRGDPKSDQEVADILGTPRVTASKRRERSIMKMRAGLTAT